MSTEGAGREVSEKFLKREFLLTRGPISSLIRPLPFLHNSHNTHITTRFMSILKGNRGGAAVAAGISYFGEQAFESCRRPP